MTVEKLEKGPRKYEMAELQEALGFGAEGLVDITHLNKWVESYCPSGISPETKKLFEAGIFTKDVRQVELEFLLPYLVPKSKSLEQAIKGSSQERRKYSRKLELRFLKDILSEEEFEKAKSDNQFRRSCIKEAELDLLEELFSKEKLSPAEQKAIREKAQERQDYILNKIKEQKGQRALDKKTGRLYNFERKRLSNIYREMAEEIRKKGVFEGFRGEIEAGEMPPEQKRLYGLLGEKKQELAEVDELDKLTGLSSISDGLEFMTDIVLENEAKGGKLNIVSLDLNFFKSCNESFGHAFGNAVLRTLGITMLEFARKNRLEEGKQVRVGGEEMLSLFSLKQGDPRKGGQLVRELSEEIRRNLNKLFDELEKKYNKGRPREERINVREKMFEALLDTRPDAIETRMKQSRQYERIKKMAAGLLGTEIEKEEYKPGYIYKKFRERRRELEQAIELRKAQNKNISNQRKALKEINQTIAGMIETLGFGGMALGFVEVDLAHDKTPIPPKDIEYIIGLVNGADTRVKGTDLLRLFDKEPRPGQKEISIEDLQELDLHYSGFNKALKKEIQSLGPGRKEIWLAFLKRVNKNRVARLKELADVKEELAKEQGTVIEEISINMQIADKGIGETAEDLEGKYNKDERRKLIDIHHKREDNLQKIRMEKAKEPLDRRIQSWRKMVGNIKRLFKKEPVWLEDMVHYGEDFFKDEQAERYLDPMYAAMNMRAFMEIEIPRIEQVIKEGKEAAIIALDLDYLKAVNEKCGHQVGDIVIMIFIQEVMERLNRLTHYGIRGEVIRITRGEEFLISIRQMTERERASSEAEGALSGNRQKVEEQELILTDPQKTKDFMEEIGRETRKKVRQFLKNQVNLKQGMDGLQAAGEYMPEESREQESEKIGGCTSGIVLANQLVLESLQRGGRRLKIGGAMREVAEKGEEFFKRVFGRNSTGTLKDLVEAGKRVQKTSV